jgi:hypothetical protein
VVDRILAGTGEDEVIPGLCQRPRIEMVVFYRGNKASASGLDPEAVHTTIL